MHLAKIISIAAAMALAACSPAGQSGGPSAASAPASASAASTSALTMGRFEGTSVRTSLGYGIVLNKGSGLKREWFVVQDAGAPASIDGPAGVEVEYKPGERYSSGQFEYSLAYSLVAAEPLTAVEIRAQLFDVFGRHIRTLSASDVADLNGKAHLHGNWRIYSENEASEVYTSVVYVAQARTATGKVYAIDSAPLLVQLKKVAAKITEADIEPKKPEK